MKETIKFKDKPDPWDETIKATLWIFFKEPRKKEIELAIEALLSENEYSKETDRDGGSVEYQFLSEAAASKVKGLQFIEPPQT